MKTIVPGNVASACSSTSRDARSRWLVGSSMHRSAAGRTSIFASATRAFSPPESTAIRFSTASPEKRKVPRIVRRRVWPSSGAARALAAVEREYTRQQAEQRRLARAVRPDEGDALAALDLEVDARVDDVVAVRLPRAREPGDAAARPWRGREGEADVPRLALDLDALEAVEHLDPALDLPRLGRLVAEALDEPLDLGDALGLVSRLGEQELAPRLALDQIVVVV